MPSLISIRRSLRLPQWATELACDESGQDLIEYGLLLGVIVSGLAALMPTLLTRLDSGFRAWGNGRNALWVPPNPL